MSDDLTFKPFFDIPIDNNPATNPTMSGVLSAPKQFKRQLTHALGDEWLTSLLIGGGAAAAMAAILMATGGTAIIVPILGKIIIGATGWGTVVASGSAAGATAVGAHRAWHWLRSNKIEEVPKEIPGNIDKFACFMAATVFRVYFEEDQEDPQQIKRKFNEWGYDDKWANDALCILQREDINIEDLRAKCTNKNWLEDALKQCGLPCDVINVDTMSRLIDRS
jgi:hypothetical protein